MKKSKSVSPVVATVVILVVVLLVALLWMRFSTPARTKGSGFGFSGNLDPSKVTPEVTQTINQELEKAAKDRK